MKTLKQRCSQRQYKRRLKLIKLNTNGSLWQYTEVNQLTCSGEHAGYSWIHSLCHCTSLDTKSIRWFSIFLNTILRPVLFWYLSVFICYNYRHHFNKVVNGIKLYSTLTLTDKTLQMILKWKPSNDIPWHHTSF